MLVMCLWHRPCVCLSVCCRCHDDAFIHVYRTVVTPVGFAERLDSFVDQFDLEADREVKLWDFPITMDFPYFGYGICSYVTLVEQCCRTSLHLWHDWLFT